MKSPALIALALAAPLTANAQTLTFDTDGSTLFIRCTDAGGTAVCDLVTDGSDRRMTCIALDAQGSPIASTGTFASLPQVLFSDLDASRIATVACR